MHGSSEISSKVFERPIAGILTAYVNKLVIQMIAVIWQKLRLDVETDTASVSQPSRHPANRPFHSSNRVRRLFVPVHHRQKRWQVRFRQVHGRADHPVTHHLAVQDLGGLQTQFNLFTIQLEFAPPQPTVGFGDVSPTVLGHP